jgi:hypothetical protein
VTPSVASCSHAVKRELYVPNSSGGRLAAVVIPLRRFIGFCRFGTALTRGSSMESKWRNFILSRIQWRLRSNLELSNGSIRV